jgi:hypothetical protein
MLPVTPPLVLPSVPVCLPLQVLLDDYEKGMTSARLDHIFKEVKGGGGRGGGRTSIVLVRAAVHAAMLKGWSYVHSRMVHSSVAYIVNVLHHQTEPDEPKCML